MPVNDSRDAFPIRLHTDSTDLESVTITNPIHPLYGHKVVVRLCHLQVIRVIVEHPQGGLVSLPVAETSLSRACFGTQIEGKTPLFDPKTCSRLVG